MVDSAFSSIAMTALDRAILAVNTANETIAAAKLFAATQTANGGTTALAGESIGANYVIRIAADGAARRASAGDLSHFGFVLGFAFASADIGSQVAFVRRGFVEDSRWSWARGPVYVGNDGEITQTPPSSGFSQVAGIAVTPTKILADFEAPVLVSGVAVGDGGLLEATASLPPSLVYAAEPLKAGQQINIFTSAGAERGRVADASLGFASCGFVLTDSPVNNAALVYRLGGMNTALLGLSPQGEYFLGAAGSVTKEQDVISGHIDQYIGTAVDETTLDQPIPQIAIVN